MDIKMRMICVHFVFRDRPSCNSILKRPLLQAKIKKFLSDLVRDACVDSRVFSYLISNL